MNHETNNETEIPKEDFLNWLREKRNKIAVDTLREGITTEANIRKIKNEFDKWVREEPSRLIQFMLIICGMCEVEPELVNESTAKFLKSVLEYCDMDIELMSDKQRAASTKTVKNHIIPLLIHSQADSNCPMFGDFFQILKDKKLITEENVKIWLINEKSKKVFNTFNEKIDTMIKEEMDKLYEKQSYLLSCLPSPNMVINVLKDGDNIEEYIEEALKDALLLWEMEESSYEKENQR